MKKIIIGCIIVLLFCFNAYSEDEEIKPEASEDTNVSSTQESETNRDCSTCPYDAGMSEEDKKVVDSAKRRNPNEKLIFLGYTIDYVGNNTMVTLGFFNNTNKDIVAFGHTANFKNSLNQPSYFIYNSQGYKQTMTALVNNVSILSKTNAMFEYRIFVDRSKGFDLKSCKVFGIRFSDGTVWERKK